MRTLKPLFTIPQHWKPVRCIRARYCSNLANTGVTSKERRTTPDKFKSQVSSGPSFEDFIRGVSVKKTYAADGDCSDHQSYLSEDLELGNSRKGWSASLNQKNPIKLICWVLGRNAELLFWLTVAVYFETYGCQMNVNDTDIAWSILQGKGYLRTVDLSEVQENFVSLQFQDWLKKKKTNHLTKDVIVPTGRCCPSGNVLHKVRPRHKPERKLFEKIWLTMHQKWHYQSFHECNLTHQLIERLELFS